MIEVIYNNKERHAQDGVSVRSMMKIPKNVMQIGESGEGNGGTKVYIEEGVAKGTTKDSYGVLLGEVYHEESDYIFVKGKIDIGKCEDEIKFNDDIWRDIYEKIKENDAVGRIVGWFYNGDKELYNLKKLHLDNFAGNNKILLKCLSEEEEPNVYMYDNDALVKQDIYYLYWGNKKIMKENGIKQRPEMVSNSKLGTNTHTVNNVPAQDGKAGGHKAFPWGSVAIIAVLVGILGYMAKSGQLDALRKAIMQDDKKEVVDVNGDYDFLDGDDVNVNIIGSGLIPTTDSDKEGATSTSEKLTSKEDTTEYKEKESTKSTEDETEVSAGVKGTYYIVKEGQSLYDICREVYGDISRIKEIIKANELDDPNLIIPGQKIFIPN